MQGARVMKVALLLVFCLYGIQSGTANSPPKFALDGASEIVVKVREGQESIGKLLYRLRGEDADGDRLTFGVVGPVGQEILRFDRLGNSEANVYLNKELDREMADSYSLVLTLTDGRMGEGQFYSIFEKSRFIMAGYLIVTFDNESSVTIVPTSWVKEEGGVKLCFWPRCSPIKLNYLVKKNEPPSTAWDLVKVCVMKYADTYEKALEYEEKAMYTSDIATDARPDCEEGEKKKKKKINKRQKSQMHEFSSEEESSSILPDFPQINKRSSVNKNTPIPAQKKSLRTENSIYIASPSSLDYSPIHPSAAVPSLSSFCPPIHPSAAVSKNPLPQLPLSCPKLPCQDPEDLSDLEKVLQDGAVFASICDYLTTIGGNSVKDTTRRVLTQIISNKLSLKYNWKGTRGVKLAFGSFTSITKLVLGAVRNNPASSTATDFQVNNIIKQWLMHAKYRDNGRNERAKN